MELVNGYLTPQAAGVLIALAAGGAIYFISRRSLNRKCYKLPPGPRGLPFIGNLIVLTKRLQVHKTFLELAEEYGDIFRLDVVGQPTVVLNNTELIREALVTKQNDFAGRQHEYTLDVLTEGKAITSGDFSPVWKQQRKIAHAAIRQYASGEHLESLVTQSFSEVAERLKDMTEPFNPQNLLSLLVYNIICSMCFGERYELDDQFILDFIKKIDDANELLGTGLLVDFIPILQYFPNPTITKIKQVVAEADIFLENIIKKHEDTYDSENLSDLTYNIIHHMNELGTVAEDGEKLTRAHFVHILSDVFFAGTDTTRYTLTWVVACMAKYPDIQRKMQHEIDDVVGSSQQVALKHRKSLPYVTAVLYETMRFRTLAPTALPHKTTCDTSVGGYDIPKDTQVFINLYAIHNDPRYWDSPEEFRPERFLDTDGQLAPKPESLLPFSAGRRVCVGEVLAKAELHMLVTLLFQRFTFAYPEGEEFDLGVIDSTFITMPQSFKVIVRNR